MIDHNDDLIKYSGDNNIFISFLYFSYRHIVNQIIFINKRNMIITPLSGRERGSTAPGGGPGGWPGEGPAPGGAGSGSGTRTGAGGPTFA